jgi:hypothetical protein
MTYFPYAKEVTTMNTSLIHKVAALCVMGASLLAPAAWGQQSTKEPVKVTGAEMQAWLSKGVVTAGEDHTNGSVFMALGEAGDRTLFYRTISGATGTLKGTARVDGDLFCAKWPFGVGETCREWYRVGENKYEGRDKGSQTKATTFYILH